MKTVSLLIKHRGWAQVSQEREAPDHFATRTIAIASGGNCHSRRQFPWPAAIAMAGGKSALVLFRTDVTGKKLLVATEESETSPRPGQKVIALVDEADSSKA